MLNERIDAILVAAERNSTRRTLESLQTPQGPHISVAGATLTNFCSNDYLGLSAHPSLKQAAIDAASRWGIGSGGAALLSGRSLIHEELERRTAGLLNAQSALLFSSGYLANLGVIGALVKRHDLVLQDRLNHASLIDAVRLSQARTQRYHHVDLVDLETKLSNAGHATRWIVSDALFSMDGDVAPLNELADLARRYQAVLIADDAHGLGVLGNGRGSVAACGLSSTDVPIQIVTFGKALGTAGAAVVGSAGLIDALVQTSRTFIYDTAPPPMVAAATIAAIDIIETDFDRHDRLQANIKSFRELAADLPLMDSETPIQPVMIGEAIRAVTVAQHLRKRGIYARAVRPPTVPSGTSRLRICLSAAHERADIESLVNVLREALTDLPT